MSSLAAHLEAEACPHLAVFLNSPDELPRVLADFYALGLRRGGWLAHRALPGDAENERASPSARSSSATTSRPALLSQVSEMHTGVLVPENGDYKLVG